MTEGRLTHDVLIHDDDDELVEATRAFVERGLSSGGQVLVHGSEQRVGSLRTVLGGHPRLDYGLDRDLYLTPMRTLFGYQRIAEESAANAMWVTGTVPFGSDETGHPAWFRYESLLNEVLAEYPFHALCTYDTRDLPTATVAAARATHPCIGNGNTRAANPAYVPPSGFLTDPRAASPRPPTSASDASLVLHHPGDLQSARRLITSVAEPAGALDRTCIDALVGAAHEALTNGLEHGRPPVTLNVWVDVATVTCLILDDGPGTANPLAGYRRPDVARGDGQGLWLARQLCDELILRNGERGGCAVLLTACPTLTC